MGNNHDDKPSSTIRDPSHAFRQQYRRDVFRQQPQTICERQALVIPAWQARHEPQHLLVKIEGVDDTNAAKFYLGKRVAFVYRASKERQAARSESSGERSPALTATAVS